MLLSLTTFLHKKMTLLRDLDDHLKPYHEFLLSLIIDRPTTKTELNHIFYARFAHASLSFDEGLSIDHHLFGFNHNTLWRNAYGLPEENDVVFVTRNENISVFLLENERPVNERPMSQLLERRRRGRACNVGVFTFELVFF